MFGGYNDKNREKWVAQKLAQVPAGYRILDAGAGELRYKKFCGHLNYVSQDFGQYEGEGNQKGLQTGTWNNSKIDIISDITSIPEPDASFDAILCVEVFEHIPNPILAIIEFQRLLKPGGVLILTAPFCSLTHFAPYHYYSGFNSYFYERFLPENNFKILELKENGNYFDYFAQELIRLPRVAKQYSFRFMNLYIRLVQILLLPLLYFLSKKDKGSSEILTYGFHILAQKS